MGADDTPDRTDAAGEGGLESAATYASPSQSIPMPVTVPEDIRNIGSDVLPATAVESAADVQASVFVADGGGAGADRSDPYNNIPGLDVAELEALGLDGASVWIQRFSSQLQSLRQAFRSDDGQARAGLELMLRLVRNVVNNPGEPKFRRIRADNALLRAKLLGPGGEAAETCLTLLGFASSAEPDGARVFLISDGALDLARLRMGMELLEVALQ